LKGKKKVSLSADVVANRSRVLRWWLKKGKLCIEVAPKDKVAWISEELCIGCGICVKKCPFEAIDIINLPKNLEGETTHRYGANSFKLHRLPMPRPGQVLGLVGANGTGKSTALKILAGKLKPNLGDWDKKPDWQEILTHFRGSELQNYFTKVVEDTLKTSMKPQYVDAIPKAVKGTVGEVIKRKDERQALDAVAKQLELGKLLDHDIATLSGGELQRFAIGTVCVQDCDVYMFDEPSSYLDVEQRLAAARAIRALLDVRTNSYVICVEHDLAVLDYLSDFVCVLYGKPGAYGVVTMPFGVREGINVFLAGFVPTENLRFRDDALTFKVSERVDDNVLLLERTVRKFSYPTMTKTLGSFALSVEGGQFSDSEIIVLLGQNGCGKTTLVRMLAGLIKPDDESTEVPELNISYKPQKIAPSFEGTVRQLLHTKIKDSFMHPQFASDVARPLRLEELLEQEVAVLSGGELQRVAVVLALGKPADVYLIDEPSAYLDSEQRVIAAKVIKRFVMHAQKTGFVVEHDFIMATYLADRVIVYEGEPSVKCTATRPQSLLTGMNKFLQMLEITFRRDPVNARPRINKMASQMDSQQKASGNYFFMDNDELEPDAAPQPTGKKNMVKK
jgi:ATP-binding cassette subfamily E protein 1